MDLNNEVTVPHSITESMPENKTVFTISTIISVLTCLVSIFALNQIMLAYRIIICLCIISLILFVNVVVLYIKEREHYYQVCYNIALCTALTKRVKEVKEENEQLKSNIHYV